jgi:hypothetical protein
VYVVLCDAEGRISDIIDSGKVLVLPQHAAEEVIALFAKIRRDMTDVQQYLPSSGNIQSASIEQQQRPQQQRRQQQQQEQAGILPLLQRILESVLGRPCTDSSRGGDARSTAAPASNSSQRSAGNTSSSSSAGEAAAAADSSRSAGIPDAVTLYAYEHFLVPFVRHWEALLLPRTAAQQLDPASAAAAAAADALAVRLLHFMLDNDLWSSAVLLMDQVPAIADYALRCGLEPPNVSPLPAIQCLSGALWPARAPQLLQQQQVAFGHSWGAADRGQQLLAVRSGLLLGANGLQQEQQQQQNIHAGLTAASLQALQAQQQPAAYGVLSYTRQFSPVQSVELPLPSNDDSSFESASEILRRALLLQQLRSEQEALAEFQQQQDAAAAPPAQRQQQSSRSNSQSGGRSSLQLALLQAQYAAAGPSVEQRLPTIRSTLPVAEDAAAELTTLEVAAAAAAEAEAAEAADQELLAQMLSAEGLEGSFAVAGPCIDYAAVLAAEGPALVPKARPPKPEHTYLEGSLSRLSFKSAGKAAGVPDAGAAGGSSSSSGVMQQQGSMAPPSCHTSVVQAADVVAHPPAAAAPPEVFGLPLSSTEQDQAGGAVLHAAEPGCCAEDSSKQLQQPRRHPIEDMLWHEIKPAEPEADKDGCCVDTTGYTVDSCDSSVYDLSEYQALEEFEEAAAAAAAAAPPPPQAAAASIAEAADAAAHYEHDSCSKSRQQQQVQGLLQPQPKQQQPMCQQLVGHMQLAVTGFEDPCLERSYLVYKNHSCALLDTTALLICGGMLAAAAMRSVDLKRDPEALGKLGMVLLYGALFFLPYAVMQLRRQLFLRYREVLLVSARTLSASLLILVAVKAVPQPDAWVSVVGNTLAMQLQNGVILPSCQQLRLPAAAAIAAAHLPSDALMLALAMPVRMAVLTSVMVQLCMLLVTVAQDAWCRHRFTQQYLGVAAGVRPARAAAARQAPTAHADDDDQNLENGASVHAGDAGASCSSAAAALRQRRPVQHLN